MIHIFVVLLMWYGDQCFITIVNTGNFSQPKASCAAHFSISYFSFKRVWAAYKWDIDLFLQWLQFVEACQARATKVCQTEPWNQNNDTLNQPVLFYSLPFSKFLFFSQDVFLTHANLEAFPKTTALAESPVWDVHLAFFLIWTLEIFLKKKNSTSLNFIEWFVPNKHLRRNNW